MSKNLNQYVVFKLGEESYGVDILQVKTIERLMPITRVPKAPKFVEGVINLRGEVVPVIDLRKRFDLEQKDASDNTRIIIINVDGITVGMIVDSASEVIQIPVDEIEPPPAIVGSIDSDYISGVGKVGERLLILLNLKKVLKSKEIEQLEKI
ncbi:MAG: purine-binding chemotaxis protein CheW [Thermosediminibacterales bacterium]|nr:purine-binding chemotaxis protein CheW [Thermosediminibacterales bacterium]